MIVSEVRLKNFRNIKSLNLELSSGVNIIIGDNGQGKSNFLESIIFLCSGQSFRPIEKSSFINKETRSPLVAQSKIVKDELNYDLKLFIDSDGTKEFTSNNKRTSSGRLRNLFPVILFSPDSLSVIKEGPEERRRLVDDFIGSISNQHGKILQDFKKCLKNRNKQLSTMAQKDHLTESDYQFLDSINQIYFDLCLKVSLLRIQYLKDLLPFVRESMLHFFKNENVDISVDYVISNQESLNDQKPELLKKILLRSDQLRSAEIASGRSLVGPHKHDIKFLFNGEDSRYFCSQGQQRALVLAFKVAQVRFIQEFIKDHPLLLLDDVLSELDLQRRRALVQFLRSINSQILITSTDLQMLEQFGEDLGKVIRVEAGLFTEQAEKISSKKASETGF